MVAKCSGTNLDGTPCSARPRPGALWCVWHDPETKSQRAEWSKRGGSARSNKARAAKTLPTELMDADEIAAWLTVCLKRVIAGQMDPPVGTAAANIARTIVEISKAALAEERIIEIERQLGIVSNRRTS